MMKTKRIGVVMGGPSKEREVSLNTGSAIVEALKEKGYDAVPIDLDPSLFPSQIEDAGVKSFLMLSTVFMEKMEGCRPSLKCLAFLTQGRAFFQAPLP